MTGEVISDRTRATHDAEDVDVDVVVIGSGLTGYMVGPAAARAGHAGAAARRDRIAAAQLVRRSIEGSLTVCGSHVVR